MDQGLLKQFLELFSPWLLLHVGLLIAAAALLLHLLHLGLGRLAVHFPRYRLQFGQAFPALRVLTWALVLTYIVLALIQPPESLMFAVLGSAGLAVGLAAQDGIRNLLAGAMMIFNPPFRVGDMVSFGGHYGEVVQLDLSVTWLHTFDDNTIMVPNAEVLRSAVVNSNSGELAEMVVVNLDLPVTIPVAKARAVAFDAARACPYTYLKKPIIVAVEARHDRDFLLGLRVKAYVVDVRLERLLASDITERILEALEATNWRTTVTSQAMRGEAALP